jgi:hypothetical protein
MWNRTGATTSRKKAMAAVMPQRVTRQTTQRTLERRLPQLEVVSALAIEEQIEFEEEKQGEGGIRRGIGPPERVRINNAARNVEIQEDQRPATREQGQGALELTTTADETRGRETNARDTPGGARGRTDLGQVVRTVQKNTKMGERTRAWLTEVQRLLGAISETWDEGALETILKTVHPTAKFFPRTGDISKASDKLPSVTAMSSARMRADDCSWRVREINKALNYGNYMRARNLLQNNGTADIAYSINIAKIREKFPEELRPRETTTIPSPIAMGIIGTGDEMATYLGRLRRGAAPGISGWSTDHLVDIMRNSEDGVTKVWKVCDAIARGEVTTRELREELTALRGVALIKGKDDVRTIGIQNPWVKVTEHLLTQQYAEKCKEICGPYQLGNKIAGGAEILVHLVQALTQLGTDKVVMKLDITNAYNSISRTAILEAVEAHIPDLLPYTHFALGNDTKVYFSSRDKEVSLCVPMKTGCPQGSPLSTLWFNMTQAGPINRVREAHPSATILSYHDDDDHYIIAEPEEAAAVFDHLQQELRSISLQVNPRKSQVYSKGQATITFDTRTRLEERGFEVLGRTKGIIVARPTSFQVSTSTSSNAFRTKLGMWLKCARCQESSKGTGCRRYTS